MPTHYVAPARPTNYERTGKETSFQADILLVAKNTGWTITLADVLPAEDVVKNPQLRLSKKLRHYVSKAYKVGDPFKKLTAFLLKRKGHTFTLGYHTHDSRGSQDGFPDLVLVHPRRGLVVFAELKTDTGQLSPPQRLWRAGLLAASHNNDGRTLYRLWTPDQWTAICAFLGAQA